MTSTAEFPLTMLNVDRTDGIATITVNRPEVLNNVSPTVAHQMQRAFESVAADPSIVGIIIGGEGKAFVVGADTAFLVRNIECGDLQRIKKFTEAGHRLLHIIENCPKPVIARVNGVALGAGTEIALACHRVVAAPGATFGFPETGLGIYPGFGGTQRAPRAVGVGLAKWLTFTGKRIPANDAKEIGLIDEVVPDAQLEQTARSWARALPTSLRPTTVPSRFAALADFFERNSSDDLRNGTANPQGNQELNRAMRSVASKAPIALRFTQEMIEQGVKKSLKDGLQMEVDRVIEMFSTKDTYTGLAFLQERKLGQPKFEDR